MASISPSVSPRWDTRNQGFVSPSQLQQWKQQQRASTYDFSSPNSQDHPTLSEPADSRSPPLTSNSQPMMGAQPSTSAPPPQQPPSAPTHSRTTSAFSLFSKHKHPTQDAPPKTSPTAPQHAHDDGDRPNILRRRPSDAPRSSADAAQPQPQPQPEQAVLRTSSSGPSLHPEIRSIVNLTIAHGQKIYFSGPMVRKLERQPDGQKPAKDEGWRDVWAQLGGTTLSLWDMKEIEEASKQGRQVPPSYINVTDAFVQVVGTISRQGQNDGPPERYQNVFSLNTAGMNLLFFSCPSTQALISWVSGLRLAAWEKSRLEEIYTAHLIRITLHDGRDAPSPLVRGRMEGWVRIRVAGQTDWKRLWMVISAGAPHDGNSVSSTDIGPGSPHTPRKKRMSNLFSREKSPPRGQAIVKPSIQLYISHKPKDRKKPVLTFRDVIQAFAVYPERPELISRSTLMKLEGSLGDEDMAGSMRNKEAWLLVMPELEGGNSRASEMLKWLIGIHDAFELYGRPHVYSWDPRDPQSMMFAYPIGPHKELLFLDREFAESLDPRDDRTPSIRSQLQRVLWDRMRGPEPEHGQPPLPNKDKPPTLPPLPVLDENEPERNEPESLGGPSTERRLSLQLPPLDFEDNREQPKPEPSKPTEAPGPRALTPITERSVPRDSSQSGDQTIVSPPTTQHSPLSHGQEHGDHQDSAPSEETSGFVNLSRPSSKMGDASARNRTPPLPPPPSKSPVVKQATPPEPEPEPVRTHPMSPEEERQTFSANVKPIAPSWERQSTFHSQATSASVYSRTTSPHPTSPSLSNANVGVRAPSPAQASTKTGQRSVAENTPTIRPIPSRLSQADQQQQDSFPSSSQGKTKSPPPMSSPPQQSPKNNEDVDRNILGEAGALYYMRHIEGNAPAKGARRAPPPMNESDEESTDSESLGTTPPPPRSVTPLRIQKGSSPPTSVGSSSPPPARNAMGPRGNTGGQGGFAAGKVSGPADQSQAISGTPATRYSNVAKPSGARAAPTSKIPSASPLPHQQQRPQLSQQPSQSDSRRSTLAYDDDHSSEHDMYGEDESAHRQQPEPQQQQPQQQQQPRQHQPVADDGFDDTSDALAALTFLDREEQPQSSAPPQPSQQPSQSIPQVVEPPREPSPDQSVDSHQARSSFAPSRQAAERRAKAQAQQAAHEAAVHRPGRVNGKGKAKTRDRAAWGESSEEEEEEEEEDDEDADSDVEPPPRRGRPEQPNTLAASMSGRPGYPSSQRGGSASPGVSPNEPAYPQPRRARDLPQVPGQMFGESNEYLGPQPPQPRRMVSDQYSEAGRRSNYTGRQVSPQPGFRPQADYPQQNAAARQSIWTQVLEKPVQPDTQGRDTFVQIEPPAQTMTKAFAPHGLLSAGLQDKQDRSAKRQEELARETGASLINVPTKPPPPQTGLLGAVTAHERERKREGGLGAALTEREREKRLAEERQRKLDEYQRMQLEQMQQTGSMYGGMGMPFSPPGFNPMMTGGMMGGPMMPMMTGGWGYPGMVNPQHMFAAQQAAQAYQQAMMAFSVAGSQAGGGEGANTPLNPMMTGGSMMDPRMSMMGMPMMSPSMGMNPAAMNGMSGMGMGMGQGMMGMGMGMGMTPQMTGGASPYSPGFSPNFDGGMRPPSEAGGANTPNQPYSSQNSSQNFKAGNAGEESSRNTTNGSPQVRDR
ncbi:hypothetical protein K474DRAFT_801299 [Panus rudis PR-1116 ss-1]|nr:hypothetical protein K474DRAFT_801299 [Panus rudis PR-1116 ss-1]